MKSSCVLRIFLAGVIALGMLSGATLTDAAALTGFTSRISLANSGAQSNGNSIAEDISSDGRYVTFRSIATNLAPGDTTGFMEVFARDRLTGKTSMVSVSSTGEEANLFASGSAISADGRTISFTTQANNLVQGDTNNANDVFVHDQQTRETIRVSVDSDENQGNGSSGGGTISASGQYVLFESAATNLVTGDTNAQNDVFLRDLYSGETSLVSQSSSGVQANYSSGQPSVSEDGRYVAFRSGADNLVSGDTNIAYDIFMRDQQEGITTRISVATGGAQGNNNSSYPVISADGRYIAFHSEASNLVAGDTNNLEDIFVHDRQTGETKRVSVASGGAQSNGVVHAPDLSADGRYVAFDSNADNLVFGDTNNERDVFVHDFQTGETERVSLAVSGAEANQESLWPIISGNGRCVAFTSAATNLSSWDTNGFNDVYLRDRFVMLEQEMFLPVSLR